MEASEPARLLSIGELMDRSIHYTIVKALSLGVLIFPAYFLAEFAGLSAAPLDLKYSIAASVARALHHDLLIPKHIGPAHIVWTFELARWLLILASLPLGYTVVMLGIDDAQKHVWRPWHAYLQFVLTYASRILPANLSYIVGVVILLVFAIVVFGVATVAGGVMMGNASPRPLIVFGAAMIAGLPLLFLLPPLVVAFFISFSAITLEEVTLFRSLGTGLRLTFGRRAYWRSMGLAMAVFAIVFVGHAAGQTVGVALYVLTGWIALFAGALAAASSLTGLFTAAFGVLFYRDLQARAAAAGARELTPVV